MRLRYAWLLVFAACSLERAGLMQNEVAPMVDGGTPRVDGGRDAGEPRDAGRDAGDARDAGDSPDAGRDAGPPPECVLDADCPNAPGPCGMSRCDAGRCIEVPAPAATPCRAGVGECDVAESCDGASRECPPDAFVAAGAVCRSAVGACDVAESCAGTSAVCAPDTGAAVACVPATPITYSARGRNARFDLVDLNGTGRTVATVAPGAVVSLRVAGSWTDTNTNCPTCITQFYARMNGVFTLCLGSTTSDATFDRSTSFTAPSARGVYIINPAETWEFECVAGTSARTGFDASSLATLIVE